MWTEEHRRIYRRGGEGYPSAGVGFKMKKGELNLTWFSEEIGTYYHSQRDVRFMFQYQMRAF